MGYVIRVHPAATKGTTTEMRSQTGFPAFTKRCQGVFRLAAVPVPRIQYKRASPDKMEDPDELEQTDPSISGDGERRGMTEGRHSFRKCVWNHTRITPKVIPERLI